MADDHKFTVFSTRFLGEQWGPVECDFRHQVVPILEKHGVQRAYLLKVQHGNENSEVFVSLSLVGGRRGIFSIEKKISRVFKSIFSRSNSIDVRFLRDDLLPSVERFVPIYDEDPKGERLPLVALVDRVEVMEGHRLGLTVRVPACVDLGRLDHPVIWDPEFLRLVDTHDGLPSKADSFHRIWEALMQQFRLRLFPGQDLAWEGLDDHERTRIQRAWLG